jgi:hypothetical protein
LKAVTLPGRVIACGTASLLPLPRKRVAPPGRVMVGGGARRGRSIVEMPKIALPFLFFLNFGPPIYWGFVDAGISAPLLWSAGMGAFVILAGWRAPQKGLFTSILIGISAAMVVNVPIYFIGRWLAMSA